MKHIGDITSIDWKALEPVDVVTGGSPCQDLSIAGKRAGLSGERSGLYMEQIKGIKELRRADELRGRTGESIRPRYMVWENVVGAFSSNKGEDFAAVLTEAVRIVEPDAPDVPVPEKGWSYSGTLMGDGWSIAWRTHDAKYWGVPQRRRRISLVCDFGGQSAPEILFECKSVSGNSAESGKEREKTAGDSGMGTEGAGGYENKVGVGCCIPINDKATRYRGGGSTRNHDGSGNGLGVGKNGDPCPTLSTADRHIVFAAGFKHKQGSGAGSVGYEREKAQTLCFEQMPAVIVLNDQSGSVMDVSEDVVSTLRVQSHGHEPLVLDARGNGDGKTVPTLTGDHNNRVTDYTALAIGNGQTNQSVGTVAGSLNCMHDQQAIFVPRIDLANMVHRLTPLECERLQGYPGGWTDIGEWADSKGKKHKDADSPRYKALGNSIALPFWYFLTKRISAQYTYRPTLGSLFDGIGGFPLCWESINGKGTALWASEIEEFPMAVTKKHFKED